MVHLSSFSDREKISNQKNTHTHIRSKSRQTHMKIKPKAIACTRCRYIIHIHKYTYIHIKIYIYIYPSACACFLFLLRFVEKQGDFKIIYDVVRTRSTWDRDGNTRSNNRVGSICCDGGREAFFYCRCSTS